MQLRYVAGVCALSCALVVGISPVPARAQTPPQTTADKAKDNTSDRDLMQKIRKSVVDDKSLSTAAHNVKIIAQNGKVTLKGQVRSDEEKKSVEQKAIAVAGADNVVNELTIKPAKGTN
jgi:hyperosmotically inducible protein